MIVSTPTARPVSIPEEETLALKLLALQVPPVVVSLRLNVVPKQIATGVDGSIADGSDFTNMLFVAVSVPQLLVTKYLICALPTPLPVTKPPLTLAIDASEESQKPPELSSVNNVDEPRQILSAPEITPAKGAGLTVTIIVVESTE